MIDLIQLLIKLGFTKDERKAKGQIDGGNVELGYVGVPSTAKIIETADGYKLSEETKIIVKPLPKKQYLVSKNMIVGKCLIVGKKFKFLREEDVI